MGPDGGRSRRRPVDNPFGDQLDAAAGVDELDDGVLVVDELDEDEELDVELEEEPESDELLEELSPLLLLALELDDLDESRLSVR